MEIEIDADGLLRIRAAKLGTQELDRLIHQLAEVRTTMDPEVPRRHEDALDAVTFTVQDDPGAYVARDADRRVSIGLRHAGFGWIAFAFTDHDARALSQRLDEVLNNPTGNLARVNARR